jgi:carbonic anhydrase/acetyltransferase-like protein (isoleucine patch superfamily)
MIQKNVKTSFSSRISKPAIGTNTFIHETACIIGDVKIGRRVMVAPFASVRADEGQPFHIGDECNIQDGVVIHALETEKNGKPIEKNLIEYNGKKYAVYIGNRVSLAHQAQIHGPVLIHENTFIGMTSLIFKAEIGKFCVIEPGSIVIGVRIPERHYVPAGSVIKTEEDAEKLPETTEEYIFKNLNNSVVSVNKELALNYLSGTKI